MTTHSSLRLSLPALALLSPLGGCINTFDATLYQRDGGASDAASSDAASDEAATDDAAAFDAASDEDTGTVAVDAAMTPDAPMGDAGPRVLELADDCVDMAAVPELLIPAGTSDLSVAIDTRALTDNIDDTLACTGTRSIGPEGFLRIRTTAHQRMHFHFRRTGSADPSLYLLPTCDVRQCRTSQSIDICGQGADEHLSIDPATDGELLLAIDSNEETGLTGTLQVIRPTCGNGRQEHSETCDDGNTDSLDGCDSTCRKELVDGDAELEVNDDRFSANHLLPATSMMTITGRIASVCESDWFGVDVTAGQALGIEILTSAGAACAGDRPANIELELYNEDGERLRGRGTARAGGCPSIDPSTDTFAAGLAAGRYYVRLYARNADIDRPFDYGLRVRWQ